MLMPGSASSSSIAYGLVSEVTNYFSPHFPSILTPPCLFVCLQKWKSTNSDLEFNLDFSGSLKFESAGHSILLDSWDFVETNVCFLLSP